MALIVDASVMVTVPGSTPKKKKGRKRCECERCYFDQFFWITVIIIIIINSWLYNLAMR